MIREIQFCRLDCLAAPLLAAIALTAAGCSGEQTAAANGPVAAAEKLFSQDELTAMRKSVSTPKEFRTLLKMKAAEREGTAVVKTKTSTGKPRR